LTGVIFITTVVESTGSDTCPQCKISKGKTDKARTKSYEEFFSSEERAFFDRIRINLPSCAAMLPPTGGRYKVISKPQNDAARKRFRKAKYEGGFTGSGDDDHHPHPLKLGGCPVHQQTLRVPAEDPSKRKVSLVDKFMKKYVNQAIERNK
jgi:hypothetical protein